MKGKTSYVVNLFIKLYAVEQINTTDENCLQPAVANSCILPMIADKGRHSPTKVRLRIAYVWVSE